MDWILLVILLGLFVLIMQHLRRKVQDLEAERSSRQAASGEEKPSAAIQAAPGPAGGEPETGGCEALDSAAGWKPMRRAEVEAETLWRLEHCLRDIPDIGRTPVLQVDYSMEPRELALTLASNPFYAARILKTVNSAAFGLSHRIDSLQRAITFLGYNQVKNIVMQQVISENLGKLQAKAEEHLDILKFWQHSHAVSVGADFILRTVLKNTRNSGVITTAALLHDIGWVVFVHYDCEKARELFRRLQQSGDQDNPVELEERQFGFNHLVLGRMLAEQWEIPGKLSELIERHHCATFGLEPGAGRELVFGACVISRAESLAAELGYANPLAEPTRQQADLKKVLGPEVDRLGDRLPELREELEKTMKFIAEFHKATA
ncbi:MAG: HDOD domain-containing protein [Candidatus Glassbacteria bacterium]|nr:HDOD domain-containing protein [Candidatus Glassbacteria bacterium]